MGFFDQYLYQQKFAVAASSVELSVPKALGKKIPRSARTLVSSDGFCLTAHLINENRLGVVSVDNEMISAKNWKNLLTLIEAKIQDEHLIQFKADETAAVMEHCLSCGAALMSHDPTELTSHIVLKIESEQYGDKIVAGEVGFCSWTHLGNYLTVCNSDARLWLFAGFLIPGSLRSDGVKPRYMLRMQQRSHEHGQTQS